MTDNNTAGKDYCEVYDEPRHQFHLRNEFTNLYEIQLPPDCFTQFHRHSEDTVYFVIADANVEESFLNKPSVLTTAQFGGTLCRLHHADPLIHQVKNIGGDVMHMVGAEALQRPPVRSQNPLSDSGHTLSWGSDRFRVYDVDAPDATQSVTYTIYGLLVALAASTITIADVTGSGLATVRLAPGSFIWIEPPFTIQFGRSFRGIFAEWI